ncbi:MAG TPA: hypothetical protein VM911_14840 [Pyrinomonadaceae bacterium]|jgi:hypothetical protein|nr:hypothetical protein [Pyrinomonadaceae bacterium]
MSDLGHAPHRRSFLADVLLGIALLFFAATPAAAQSQDISFPTPVSTNEISSSITPRDIGDARLTRHFFLLAGAPGDLIFTVTSNNLNGDVDLFTAGSLRPLGKISMYAGTSATSASKTIFLRQHEQLILRVEARSPNDNQGTYSVRFEGTFEPVMAAATPPEESITDSSATNTDRTDSGVRRVTSAGARIDEPEPEITARTETTTNTDSSNPAATTASPTETPAPVEPTTRTETPRTTRARRPSGRRRIRVQPQTRRSSEPTNETGRTADSAPAVNPRLIIETTDGTRTERFMNTVRSVTIQNGQIVIVSREGGKTERISLATVLKMTIEP